MAQRADFNPDELEVRAREVLREIVLQYVSSGEPVSSRSLAKGGKFELSPASLRNVMADLEDLGYVDQPHTSAGRVPTDRGYRFFIDHLMKSRKLTQHERDVIDERVGGANELDEVMHEASSLLSRLSDQVGIAFVPTLHQFIIRSIDFILVSEKKILCVLVGTNGVVVNKMLDVNCAVTRDELDTISRYLSVTYAGSTLRRVQEELSALAGTEQSKHDPFMQKTIQLGIDAADDQPAEQELFVEGTSSIFTKPEYADANTLRRTISALQEKQKLVEILNTCLNEDGVQIVVGAENTFTRSHNFALVATRYGTQHTQSGIVGIIGPTRMEYGRIGPLVEYLGQVLSRKIEETSQEQS